MLKYDKKCKLCKRWKSVSGFKIHPDLRVFPECYECSPVRIDTREQVLLYFKTLLYAHMGCGAPAIFRRESLLDKNKSIPEQMTDAVMLIVSPADRKAIFKRLANKALKAYPEDAELSGLVEEAYEAI